jgi:hypothetical protein
MPSKVFERTDYVDFLQTGLLVDAAQMALLQFMHAGKLR